MYMQTMYMIKAHFQTGTQTDKQAHFQTGRQAQYQTNRQAMYMYIMYMIRCARKREAMLNSGGHRTVLHLMFDYTQESRTEYQNGYFLQAAQYIQGRYMYMQIMYIIMYM